MNDIADESIVPAAVVLHPLDAEMLGAASPEQRVDLAVAALFKLAVDGADGESGSRYVTAHHEAGHTILAAALGYVIDGLRIETDPADRRRWIGRTRHRYPGEAPGVCVPSETPAVAERIAMVDLAGFLAEGRAHADGQAHPKSSIDERLRAGLACAALDDATGSPPGATLRRVIDSVLITLGRNVGPFYALVALLMREARPTRRQLAAILESVKPSTDFREVAQ